MLQQKSESHGTAGLLTGRMPVPSSKQQTKSTEKYSIRSTNGSTKYLRLCRGQTNAQTKDARAGAHATGRQSFNSNMQPAKRRESNLSKDAVASAGAISSSKQTAPVTCCVPVSLGSSRHSFTQLRGETARMHGKFTDCTFKLIAIWSASSLIFSQLYRNCS